MTETNNQFLVLGFFFGAGISILVCITIVFIYILLRNRRQKKNAMLTPLVGVVFPKGNN